MDHRRSIHQPAAENKLICGWTAVGRLGRFRAGHPMTGVRDRSTAWFLPELSSGPLKREFKKIGVRGLFYFLPGMSTSRMAARGEI
jgi:hypothetical protein